MCLISIFSLIFFFLLVSLTEEHLLSSFLTNLSPFCRYHLSSSLFCTLSWPESSSMKWLSRWLVPLSHGQQNFTQTRRRYRWGGGRHEATPFIHPGAFGTPPAHCFTCYWHLHRRLDLLFAPMVYFWIKTHGIHLKLFICKAQADFFTLPYIYLFFVDSNKVSFKAHVDTLKNCELMFWKVTSTECGWRPRPVQYLSVELKCLVFGKLSALFVSFVAFKFS